MHLQAPLTDGLEFRQPVLGGEVMGWEGLLSSQEATLLTPKCGWSGGCGTCCPGFCLGLPGGVMGLGSQLMAGSTGLGFKEAGAWAGKPGMS